MSAIQSFFSQKTNEELEAITFKGSKLIIISHEGPTKLFFMARVDQKEKDKNVRKELRKLAEHFVKDYKFLLKDWDGDLSVFEGFENRILDYFD